MGIFLNEKKTLPTDFGFRRFLFILSLSNEIFSCNYGDYILLIHWMQSASVRFCLLVKFPPTPPPPLGLFSTPLTPVLNECVSRWMLDCINLPGCHSGRRLSGSAGRSTSVLSECLCCKRCPAGVQQLAQLSMDELWRTKHWAPTGL